MKRQIHVSMPGYVNMELIRFKHHTPKRRQDQPYQHVIPNYGAKTQYAVGPDGTALLDKDDKKIRPKIHRHIPVLCKISRQYDAGGIECIGIQTSKTNKKDDGKSNELFRLCSVLRRGSDYIP